MRAVILVSVRVLLKWYCLVIEGGVLVLEMAIIISQCSIYFFTSPLSPHNTHQSFVLYPIVPSINRSPSVLSSFGVFCLPAPVISTQKHAPGPPSQMFPFSTYTYTLIYMNFPFRHTQLSALVQDVDTCFDKFRLSQFYQVTHLKGDCHRVGWPSQSDVHVTLTLKQLS